MRKRFAKKIDTFLKLYVGAPLGALLLYLIHATLRWERLDLDKIDESTPYIAAFWHGRQLMLGPIFQRAGLKRSFSVLISAHRDGRMIASAIRFFGLGSVAGSSTRGGARAMMELIEILRKGTSVGITPDGPKGPIYKAKEGAVKLAQVSGVPIYPVSYSAKKVWQFKSWDKMILPKPFSRGVLIIGEPISVPKHFEAGELELYLSRLEDALNEVTKKSDEYRYA